jgi:hypothetical protein
MAMGTTLGAVVTATSHAKGAQGGHRTERRFCERKERMPDFPSQLTTIRLGRAPAEAIQNGKSRRDCQQPPVRLQLLVQTEPRHRRSKKVKKAVAGMERGSSVRTRQREAPWDVLQVF